MTVSSIAPTPLSYWHLWTDGAGISHQQLCSFRPFSGAPLNPNVAAQWSSPLLENGNSFLTQLPVGWWGSGMKTECRSGSLFSAAPGLSKAWMGCAAPSGPGSFGGDQGCQRRADGRCGHLSSQIGAEPCLQLILQRNDDAWRNAPPGSFS